MVVEFRANDGHVQGFGSGLVLRHAVGARSGERRTTPVAAVLEGGSWLVIASAAGATKDPGWAFDLRARPDVEIETPQGSVDVHAIELTEDDEWSPALARFLDRSATFGEYRERAAPRRMPIFRLKPRG